MSEGKLAGTFTGEGRARRFDLDRAMLALNGRLDPGQMIGNGASTKAAIKAGLDDSGEAVETGRAERNEVPTRSPDGYELARIQKAEEEARRLRLQNMIAEGKFVHVGEVELRVARALGQEVAELETVLRDGARRCANHLALDFKAVRKIMTERFRVHRRTRAEILNEQADAAQMTEAENRAVF